MESMGVTSGCGEQEVGVASGSGWNLWVWLLDVVVRRVYRFPHTTYPYSSCICSFCSSILILLNVFCSLYKQQLPCSYYMYSTIVWPENLAEN